MTTDKPFPVEPLESKRAEFEQGVRKIAVEQLGYSNNEAMLSTILERNRNGRYTSEWVRGAWAGYNMAHQELLCTEFLGSEPSPPANRE